MIKFLVLFRYNGNNNEQGLKTMTQRNLWMLSSIKICSRPFPMCFFHCLLSSKGIGNGKRLMLRYKKIGTEKKNLEGVSQILNFNEAEWVIDTETPKRVCWLNRANQHYHLNLIQFLFWNVSNLKRPVVTASNNNS